MNAGFVDQYCPECRRVINRAQSNNDTSQPAPKDGDPGICCYCATLLKFDENGAILRLYQDEFLKLPQATQRGLRRAIVFIKAQQRGEK